MCVHVLHAVCVCYWCKCVYINRHRYYTDGCACAQHKWMTMQPTPMTGPMALRPSGTGGVMTKLWRKTAWAYIYATTGRDLLLTGIDPGNLKVCIVVLHPNRPPSSTPPLIHVIRIPHPRAISDAINNNSLPLPHPDPALRGLPDELLDHSGRVRTWTRGPTGSDWGTSSQS